jgi:hypothetical protein
VAFTLIYFGVFCAVAIGCGLFLRTSSPAAKKRWLPRVYLLSIAVLAPFLIAPLVWWNDWLGLGLFLLIVLLAAYVSVVKTRVCDCCGTVAEPLDLVRPRESCPKCGERLSPGKLFGAPRS